MVDKTSEIYSQIMKDIYTSKSTAGMFYYYERGTGKTKALIDVAVHFLKAGMKVLYVVPSVHGLNTFKNKIAGKVHLTEAEKKIWIVGNDMTDFSHLRGIIFDAIIIDDVPDGSLNHSLEPHMDRSRYGIRMFTKPVKRVKRVITFDKITEKGITLELEKPGKLEFEADVDESCIIYDKLFTTGGFSISGCSIEDWVIK